MDWSDFHFLRPWWFLGLLPVFAVAGWYWFGNAKAGAGEWRKLVDEKLLPALISGKTDQRSRRSLVLTLLAGVVAVTALAGPAWKRLPQPLYETRSAMVVILDLSRSMLATDLKPNRLMRARLKLIDLLRERKEGETGLVVFAGDAFTVSPLTDDVKTILSLLQDLSVDLMPTQGSRLSSAIEQAAQLMKQAGHPLGSVVALTDGGDGSAIAAASKAEKSGYRVSVIGVGTPEGAPAPLPKGGFVSDASGQVVVHKLDEAFLREVTQAGGGVYHRIAADSSDVQAVLSASENKLAQNQSVKKRELQQDQWREEGPWLLLLLVPMVVLAFRRGYLLLLVFLLPMPQPARAADLGRWFENPDQRGRTLLEKGEAEKAAGEFTRPDWKASALYRAGKYDQALKLWREQHTPDAEYNAGNALARMGKLPQAIDAYEKAIKQDPENSDAVKNRDLLKKLLEKQKKQQQQKQQQGQQQQDKQDQSASQQQKGEQQEPQKGDQSQQQDGEQKQDSQQGEQSQQQDGKEQDQQTGDKKKAGQESQQQGKEGKQQDNSETGSDKQQGEQQQAGDAEEETKPDAEQTAGQQDGGDKQQKADSKKDQPDSAGEDEQPPNRMDRRTRRTLRKIPDDPGGLMRRKFLYQYRQRGGVGATEGETW